MELTSALSLLTLFSITIFLGFIGNLIFDKTKIPDVVWLLLFGLLVGPVFNLIDTTMFLMISSLLGAVALLIILFDAGLNMDFYTTIKQFPRATVLAILGILSSMIAIGLISVYLFNFDFLTGMLLGAIVGGISSPIVVTMVSNLQIREHVKTMLELESILTDPLCIVIAIALMQLITSAYTNHIVHNIIASFSIGIVIGSIGGLLWLTILDIFRKKPFAYMLTLAMLLITYVFVETIAGSGAIAALFFGIILGNGRIITKLLKFEKRLGIKPFIKSFHREISFFMRSFFFVYLGLIVSINTTYIIYGIGISAILILLRVIFVQIAAFRATLTNVEMNIMRIMTPRGLAAAVLAQLPLQAGIIGGNIISNVVFIAILCTVIYAAVAIKFFYKPVKAIKSTDKKAEKAVAEKMKAGKLEAKLQKPNKKKRKL